MAKPERGAWLKAWLGIKGLRSKLTVGTVLCNQHFQNKVYLVKVVYLKFIRKSKVIVLIHNANQTSDAAITSINWCVSGIIYTPLAPEFACCTLFLRNAMCERRVDLMGLQQMLFDLSHKYLSRADIVWFKPSGKFLILC